MRALALALLLVLPVGCTTMQATPYVHDGASFGATAPAQVDVLFSAPQRAYTSIGIVSARKYKPGFADPTVSDAIPELRGAAAQLGAHAVIVRGSTPGYGRRIITVEGEAIRYTEAAAPAGG